jgi:hypothetical protein
MSTVPILANVATPVFFPQPLLACLALVPIIVIETCTLRRSAPFRWRDVSVANVLSTILGIPVALITIAVLGQGIVMVDRLYATLPAVVLFLVAVVAPCFALSVFLEGYYLRHRMREVGARTFWFAVLKAHYYSYLALVALYCVWISYHLAQ